MRLGSRRRFCHHDAYKREDFGIITTYFIISFKMGRSPMERVFHIRDWWGNGIALWVVVLILFTSPLFLIALKGVSLENDITTWLPKDHPDARSLEWFSGQFERDDQVILAWDSSSLLDPRVDVLVSRLEETGPQKIHGIHKVTSPGQVIQTMVDNKVPEDEAIKRLTGVLVGVGFLKVKLTDAGRQHDSTSRQRVQEIATRLLGRKVNVLPAVGLSQTPEPSAGTASPSVSFEMPQHDFQLQWAEISADFPQQAQLQRELTAFTIDRHPIVEDVFFNAGAPVALAVSLEDDGDDALRATLAAIEQAALDAGVPQAEFRLAGSPISRLRLNEEAKRAVWNRDYPAWNLYKRMPILLSALVGVLASFILLRSIRLSILVTAASLYTCLVVVALIPLTGNSLNMVLIVLPDLLLVLTTSGAIHLANYWKHAVTQGAANPIASAVKMAWQPCVLASVTTAVGMASLLTAVLAPVQEFGFYSSVGCLVSLAMILIGFPSMLSVWPGRGQKFVEHAAREATMWGHLGRRIVHHRGLISLTSLGLFFFCVTGLQWFKTETKVIRYFPQESQISRDYHFLEESLSGIVSVDTVLRFNQAALESMNINDRIRLVRQVEEGISSHPRISGTLSLADFRDPVEPPTESSSTLQKIRFGKTLQRIEKGIFEDERQEASRFTRKASIPLDLTTSSGRPFLAETGDEIWRIRAQSILTGDVNYSNLTAELEQIVSDAIQRQPGTDYLVTGMVPLFLRTQQAVLESLINSFGLAFIVIAVVMMILLRSPTSGLLAMLPNLFPVGVVFGLVAWSGMPVDIGTMITASVALGIAVDGTLHLLTWYRDGIRHGLTQEDSVVLALQHCGPAMWQTSATIALGIVIVSGADLLLISRFGILMAGLVSTALIADVILLPALLGGGLGRLIARNTSVSEPVPEDAPVTLERNVNSPQPAETAPWAARARS